MINTEHGTTEVKGSTEELITDLACVISGLYKTISEEYDRVAAAMLISKAVELGINTPDSALTITML